MSSTDHTPAEPTTPVTGSTAAGTTTAPADGTTAGGTADSSAVDSSTSHGHLGAEPTAGSDTFPEGSATAEQQPGWVSRHTTLLTTVMVAVIVAALAVAGLTYYRHTLDERNDDTEAAFAEMVAGQGAAVETVECDGDTCAAVIAGQAYTVLVQEDEDGEQHFGVSAYAGD